MLRKGYGGLYKAPTKEERRKQKVDRREIRSSLLILDLKDGQSPNTGGKNGSDSGSDAMMYIHAPCT